jgi:hypothetical protein
LPHYDRKPAVRKPEGFTNARGIFDRSLAKDYAVFAAGPNVSKA